MQDSIIIMAIRNSTKKKHRFM